MWGHSFSPAHHPREGSNDHMTPFSNGDASADPILGQAPDHHMLSDGSWAVHGPPQMLHERSLTPSGGLMKLPRYSQGPQGDPFAPPPPPIFYPLEEPIAPPPPKQKRKRKPRREEECGMCHGDDSKNKKGVPERMLTCVECGRSGHPSCLGLSHIGDTIRLYPWQCGECKTCEICHEKGDDAHILLCDNCERGWHSTCLEPPLEEMPEGNWHCPECPPLPNDYLPETSGLDSTSETPPMDIDPSLDVAIDPALREIAATPASHSLSAVSRRKSNTKKGKGRAIDLTHDVEAAYVEVDDDVSIRSPLKGRMNVIGSKKTKARHRAHSPFVVLDEKPLSTPSRPSKRPRMRVPSPPPRPSETPAPKRVVMLRLPMKGKGKAKETDEDEDSHKGIFDDVLNEGDRETSKTTVLMSDKERFEKSKSDAEIQLAPPAPSLYIEDIPFDVAGPSSRPLRSTMHQLQAQAMAARTVSPSPSTPSTSFPVLHKDTGTLRIRTIRFGPFDIETWYDAPFPEEFSNCPDGRLWICEFCLKYMKSRFGAQRHRMKCKTRHPPGDEIYRDGTVSIFEVDGRKNKIYCQNLCLLSKMFLDHKSLFYDVEPFLFYVMTEVDDIGARFIGYFSKEKSNPKDLNLSCIMTLPVRQRRGWGNFLIDFSYLLSKKENKTGTPERPLSALGALGYRNYWTLAVMRYLQTASDNPRLEDISSATAMTLEDIYVTLLQQAMIFVQESTPASARPSPGHSIKFHRGRKNGLTRRASQRTPMNEGEKPKHVEIPTDYEVHWEQSRVMDYLGSWEQKGYYTLKPERLKWSPFVLFRPLTKDLSTLASNPVTESSDQALKINHRDKESTEKDSEAADADITSSTPSRSVKEPPPNTTPGTPIPNGLDKLADAALLFSSKIPVIEPGTDFEPNVGDSSEAIDEAQDAELSLKDAQAMQLAEDEALAYQLANSSPITRRLRHHSRTTSSHSRPTTPSVSGTVAREPKVDAPPTRTRSSRSTSGRSPPKPVENHVDTDAALAEQLAREDERPRRSLRSASNTVPIAITNTPAPIAPPSATKSSPRKRPRVIESPDEDRVPSIVADMRPATRASARRLSSLVTDSERLPPSPMRSTRSRNANGGSQDHGLDLESGVPPPSPLGLRTSSRLNAAAIARIPSSVKPTTLKTRNTACERDVDRHKKDEEEQEAIPETHNIELPDTVEEDAGEVKEDSHVVEARVDADMKTEDDVNGGGVHMSDSEMGVDLNAGQSDVDIRPTTPPNEIIANGHRHSVVPSDMTVYVTPDAAYGTRTFMKLINGVHDKEQSPHGVDGAFIDKLPLHEAHGAFVDELLPHEIASGDVVDSSVPEEDLDLDAEGEDEDAEGEPDTDYML